MPFGFGFSFWVPLSTEHDIYINKDNMQIRVWFDRKNFHGGETLLQKIKQLVNAALIGVNIDILKRNVPEELVDFIYQEKDRPVIGIELNPNPNYSKSRQAYDELCQEILTTAIDSFNRLIAYFKLEKGQFWLEQRMVNFGRMASDFNEFRAQIKCGDRGWVRWAPTQSTTIIGTVPDDSRLVSESDWPEAVDFIKGDHRPTLFRELLSNAETLASLGFRRSAIIEGVAALEVAISGFARDPKAEAFSGRLSEDMNKKSLKTQIEHLGISGTIRYLFPLLFDKDKLPAEVLRRCQEAYDIRGNVVHHGQREVDEISVQTTLQSLRQMCEILKSYTKT